MSHEQEIPNMQKIYLGIERRNPRPKQIEGENVGGFPGVIVRVCCVRIAAGIAGAPASVFAGLECVGCALHKIIGSTPGDQIQSQ